MNRPGIIKNDPWLEPFEQAIIGRLTKFDNKLLELTRGGKSLVDFAAGHLYFPLQYNNNHWVMREYAPNATAIYLIGDCNNWQKCEDYRFKQLPHGTWEIILDGDKLYHEQKYKLLIEWEGGAGERLPSYAKRVVQDENTKVFDAQVWMPEYAYNWKYEKPTKNKINPLIYEAHVGMASELEKVGSYTEFKNQVLPRIKKAGYNAIQLMAIQEHPYYGSFGYHVSNYFAVSSRFGTPYELKELVDEAHRLGLYVIMDLVHSHSVKNEMEGLGRFDGSPNLYFHGDHRREHVAWDSLCFDYGKNEVLHFLLSNCRYWIEEFNFDGFRFDGITSMLYYDHGLERDFTSYDMYYDGGQDDDAIVYLMLANKLIHSLSKHAITIAEDMSGMPGLASPLELGGYGFDYRLAMGTPDYWIKLIKEVADENWPVGGIYHEMTSKRSDEKTISYAESHDQALVGDKTIIFRLIDKEMYFSMNKASENLVVDRGIALHKMIRLITASTAGGGYLNFMGNEFGHPEWIDFPREGNNWSYKYAKRQWSLMDNNDLKYHYLSDFDRAMIELISRYKLLEQDWCSHIFENPGDQVLVFERCNLLFVFNFNPVQSFTDYGFSVQPGKYKTILNTDSEGFGGFGRIDEGLVHYPEKHGKPASLLPYFLKLYIPSRTAMVMERIPPRSVYDV